MVLTKHVLTGPPVAVRPAGPVPLLFLIADTGGGHRSAARAVGEALELAYPGRFAPVLCDPLGGPGSAWPLRWSPGCTGRWSGGRRGCGARPTTPATRARPCGCCGAPCCAWPTGPAAARRPGAPARGDGVVPPAHRRWRPWRRGIRSVPGAPVVTVVTDLATMHAAWRYADADLIIAPPAAAARPARPAMTRPSRPGSAPARRLGRWPGRR